MGLLRFGTTVHPEPPADAGESKGHLAARPRRARPERWALVFLSVIAAAGCIPDVSVDDSRVTAPQIVAVQSVPAEAAAGTAITWTALYVTPQGDVASAPISWNLCTTPRALTDTGPVDAACFGTDPSDVVSLGTGLTVTGALSKDACRIYGPDPPASQPGQPAGRPVDPDITGGYYQPLVLHAGAATVGATRLRCGLATATQDQSAEFTRRYIANANPTLAQLTLDGVALPPSGTGAAPSVKVGSQHAVTASWPDCSEATDACGGAEPYVLFDATSRQIVARREAMHVSWYTTAGAFRDARGGVTEAQTQVNSLDDVWAAPGDPGVVTLWVVLVDDRGGTGWQSYQVQVTP